MLFDLYFPTQYLEGFNNMIAKIEKKKRKINFSKILWFFISFFCLFLPIL